MIKILIWDSFRPLTMLKMNKRTVEENCQARKHQTNSTPEKNFEKNLPPVRFDWSMSIQNICEKFWEWLLYLSVSTLEKNIHIVANKFIPKFLKAEKWVSKLCWWRQKSFVLSHIW